MISYQDLLKIKDSYARVWTFMAAAAHGGAQNCYFVAPVGAIHHLSECSFGKTRAGITLMVNNSSFIMYMEPGNTYRIAECDLFQDCVLDVMIDNDGRFHILKDTIFKIAGHRFFSTKQVEDFCNNRNLCATSAMFRQLACVPESIYVRNRNLKFTADNKVELSFAGETMSIPINAFDGFELLDEECKTVRKYWRVQHLQPYVAGVSYYSESVQPRAPDEREMISSLLGELMVAIFNDPDSIILNFEILENMSKRTADLYFMYNEGLLVCDRITGEHMLVPNESDISLFSRVDQPDRCFRIDNSGVPTLISNSL